MRRRVWSPFNPIFELRPGDASAPLFVIPGIGGLGLDLFELAGAIRYPGPICLCFPPGLDGTAPPVRTVRQSAAHRLEAICQRQPTGPFHLLGYSGGGVVALEISRLLRAQGQTVAFLGMIDTPLPEHLWPWSARIAFLLALIRVHMKKLRGLTPGRAAGYLTGRLAPLFWRVRRLLGSTGDAWSPYRIEGLPPGVNEVWEAELDAADALELEPLDQEVIFFDSDATLAHYGDPRRIWPRYVRRMEFRAVAGGHSNILVRPDVLSLAAEISTCLKTIRGAG